MEIRDRIIELRRVKGSELVPNPRNFRKHPERQRSGLRTLVAKIGFAGAELVRILPDGGLMLIDGHLRADEFKNSVLPVLVTDLDEDEANALLATFDSLGGMAEIDVALYKELSSMVKNSFDEFEDVLEDIGDFYDVPLDEGAQPEAPEAQIDRADELLKVWQVERGQLWVIPSKSGKGVHRLLCGDSTNADDVARVMAGERADICFTSPPYNMGENAQTDGYLGKGNKSKYTSVNADNLDDNSYFDLLRMFTQNAINHCEYVFVNIQMLAKNKFVFIDYLHEFKKHVVDVAIWNKAQAQPALAENIFTSAFEFILCFTEDEFPSRAIRTAQFDRGMLRNVYESGNGSRNEFADMHAATFPVEFVSWGINNFSNKDSGVYDPFLGSGTTLVACEQTGRLGRGIELAEKYCAVILQRLADMGLQPELVS